MIDESELIEHVKHQRWYGAKSRDVAHAQVVDSVALRTADPQYALALAELRYGGGDLRGRARARQRNALRPHAAG